MCRYNSYAWMLCLALATQPLLISDAHAGKKSKGGGNQTPPPPDVPFELQSERYYLGYGIPDECLGEDDELKWLATGTLQPGESFSFTPQLPGCYRQSAAITVVASWESGTLELSTIVPDADLASWDAEQAGRHIIAPSVANSSQLCMFPAFTSSGVDYTITLTNNSSEAVHGIELNGRHENDWSIFFYPRCLNADADGDGWNDSLEHSMAELLYPVGYIDQVFQPDILWGSNYLRSTSQSPAPGDEIDSFPPDLDDDGVVTLDDIAIIESQLGEGNGIPISQISPNPGAYFYYENALPFRRYDLDGDGLVAESDVRIAETYLNLELPVIGDPVLPTARLTSHQDGDFVTRGSPVVLKAHAWDNAALARVDYLVNGRVVCSRSNPVPSNGFQSPLFNCLWEVPKRARNHTLEIQVYDASGNAGVSEPTMVQSQ